MSDQKKIESATWGDETHCVGMFENAGFYPEYEDTDTPLTTFHSLFLFCFFLRFLNIFFFTKSKKHKRKETEDATKYVSSA